MKDKKLKEVEVFERRWLHHAKNESKIFEAHEIKQAMKEGWKFWPWEVDKKEVKEVKEVKVKTSPISDKLKEIYEEDKKGDKKEEMSTVVIQEIDCPVTANPEMPSGGISTEELEKCLQKQQPK